MEDVFKFLIVAGTIAFGIFKQVNKEKARKPENQMPLPEPEFDEYEPEEPVVFEMPEVKPAPAKPVTLKPLPKEGVRTTKGTIPPPKKTKTKETAENNGNEYSIRSAEEARRAIILSEILRRKY